MTPITYFANKWIFANTMIKCFQNFCSKFQMKVIDKVLAISLKDFANKILSKI